MRNELVVGDGRVHLDTELMGESLIVKSVVAGTATTREVAMVPTCAVIGLGGRLIDRGAAAVLPLCDEIVAARAAHPMLVAVGGGARMRHVYHVALDLGIPTGGLALLASACEEQNAVMLQALLSPHNAVFLKRDHFTDLPQYLHNGLIPITLSMPPYRMWEPPAKAGRVPANGADLGVFMTAEALGARACVLVKDVDGLYEADPAHDPDAKFIADITADELIARDLPSLVVERAMVDVLRHARFVKEVQIVNGLVPGRLTAALEGKHVGTVIRQGAR